MKASRAALLRLILPCESRRIVESLSAPKMPVLAKSDGRWLPI